MLMNAEQAAKKLGRDPAVFRRWASSGRVHGVFKIGVSWVAPLEAWAVAAEEVRKPGRKSKTPPPQK